LFFFQKKYKVETEVENWIQKYDSDMGERQVGVNNILMYKSLSNTPPPLKDLGEGPLCPRES
jgi:hypothetical protein